MKNKILSWLKLRKKRNAFSRGMSFFIAVCFVLNIAYLPAFAQSRYGTISSPNLSEYRNTSTSVRDNVDLTSYLKRQQIEESQESPEPASNLSPATRIPIPSNENKMRIPNPWRNFDFDLNPVPWEKITWISEDLRRAAEAIAQQTGLSRQQALSYLLSAEQESKQIDIDKGLEEGTTFNQALALLNEFLANSGQIINSAANALSQVITGADKALLALQALCIDIATGNFDENSVQGQSLNTTLNAIIETAKLHGLDLSSIMSLMIDDTDSEINQILNHLFLYQPHSAAAYTFENIQRAIANSNSIENLILVAAAYAKLEELGITFDRQYPVLFLDGINPNTAMALSELGYVVVPAERLTELAGKIAHEATHINNFGKGLTTLEDEVLAYRAGVTAHLALLEFNDVPPEIRDRYRKEYASVATALEILAEKAQEIIYWISQGFNHSMNAGDINYWDVFIPLNTEFKEGYSELKEGYVEIGIYDMTKGNQSTPGNYYYILINTQTGNIEQITHEDQYGNIWAIQLAYKEN